MKVKRSKNGFLASLSLIKLRIFVKSFFTILLLQEQINSSNVLFISLMTSPTSITSRCISTFNIQVILLCNMSNYIKSINHIHPSYE